eukprot:SAG11_NODE_8320_length_1029_cov_1.769892_2_plen_103_part_00
MIRVPADAPSPGVIGFEPGGAAAPARAPPTGWSKIDSGLAAGEASSPPPASSSAAPHANGSSWSAVCRLLSVKKGRHGWRVGRRSSGRSFPAGGDHRTDVAD